MNNTQDRQVGFLRTWRGEDRVFRTAAWFSIPYNLLAFAAVLGLARQFDWKRTVPYVAYFTVLVGTVLLFANAEINTRVCASAPILYWVFGRWQLEADESVLRQKGNGRGSRWIDLLKKYSYVAYATVYFVVEMILVPTFIGWI